MYIRKLLLPLLTTTLMFSNVYSAIATESGRSPEELLESELISNIQQGNFNAVTNLIKDNPTLSEPYYIELALKAAAQHGQPEILKYLLDEKHAKQTNTLSDQKENDLMLESKLISNIRQGKLSSIKKLIEDNPDQNYIEKALKAAAQFGQSKILKSLLGENRKKLTSTLSEEAELQTELQRERDSDLIKLTEIITEQRDQYDEDSKDYNRYENTLNVIGDEHKLLNKLIEESQIRQQRKSRYQKP